MLRILTWPISLALWIIREVLAFAGGIIGFLIGGAIFGVGLLLCKTILLAIVGVPLCIIGGVIALKSLF